MKIARILTFLIFIWVGCWITNSLYTLPGTTGESIFNNWHQYGLAYFHGQMATNPGGLDENEKPILYMGHRPSSLYPVYFVEELFSFAGDTRLPFFIVLTTAVSISIWFLMGKDKLAVVCAALLPFCPSFVDYALSHDTIGVTVLIGLPVMAVVAFLWNDPRIWARAAATVLAAAYIQINWPTIFPLAACLAYLFALKPADWKRLCILGLICAVSLALVAYLSVSARIVGAQAESEPGQSQSGFEMLSQTYLWGSGGYGGDSVGLMGAIIRIGGASTSGLLPYFVVLGVAVCSVFFTRGSLPALLSLLPITSALIGILGLRNLFGHHPWMAGPCLLVGVFFSIALARHFNSQACAPLERRPLFVGSLSFVFFFFVILVDREKSSGEIRLTELVKNNTPRSARILITENAIHGLSNTERASHTFDRKTMLDTEWHTGASPNREVFLLSTSPTYQGQKPVATMAPPDPISRKIFDPLLDFYRKHVAHRHPGDRIEADGDYYLYLIQK